jgi:hypothetical protein
MAGQCVTNQLVKEAAESMENGSRFSAVDRKK